MKALEWLYELTDVSEALQRSIEGTKDLGGQTAKVVGAVFIGIGLACFGLAFHFDILSSVDWTENARNAVASSVSVSVLAPIVPIVAYALAFLPTAVELFGVRLARVGIKVAAWLFCLCMLFDMWTDAPSAFAFIDSYVAAGAFDWAGDTAPIVIGIAKALKLMASAFIYEVLAIVFTLTGLGLVRAPQTAGRGRRQEV